MFRVFVFLILSLVLCSSGFAAHGDTAEWQKKMGKMRSAATALVPNRIMPSWWSEEQKELVFRFQKPDGKSEFRSLDLESGEIIAVANKPKNARKSVAAQKFLPKFKSTVKARSKSPDGKWKIEPDGTVLKLVSSDGKEKILEFELPEGSIWNGDIFWHPDSSCFAICHSTQHPKRELRLIRSSPKDQLQPVLETYPYDKPGDLRNIDTPVIFPLGGQKPIQIDSQLVPNPYSLSGFYWHQEGHRFCLEFIERGFGKFRLIEIDVDTAKQRIRAAEESEKFVHVFANTFHQQLQEKDEILWLSERSGYLHLYLIDGKTGDVIRQLTKGGWVVRKVLGVDEDLRRVLIELAGYYPEQDPYYIHYAYVGLDNGELTLLTEADGTHEVSFSPDGKHYLAKWSRVDRPATWEVCRSSDQKKIATLNKPDLGPLLASGWQKPQPFVTKDRNGKYDIHGVIWRPSDFDAAKKYSVIEHIYAGPHGHFVPKSFRAWSGGRSEMAEAGFIVVQIDGLGTNYRGREFQQVAYKNLKDSGFPDRIKWLKAAAEKYPEMDLTRVGIYGGSAGGQSSTAALLHYPEFYKAAVSDCGCHDNRIDKLWWNEQWMGWPVDESYAENSNLTHIHKLKGALMLTVGEIDSNVDPASTLQVVNALIQADKDFEFYLIPNVGHSAGEMPHLRRKRIQFFQKHLQP